MVRILTFAFSLLIFYSTVNAESAREYFKFAKFNYDSRQFEKALDYINSAIELEPDYTNGFLLRAEIYFNLGDFKHSIEDVTSAFTIGKISESTLAKYYLLRAKSHFGMKELVASLADVNKSLRYNDSNSEAFYLKSNINIEKNRLFEAIEAMNMAVSLDPSNIEYYLKRAEMKKDHYKPIAGSSTYEKIMADLDKVIALKPNEHRAYELRCEMLKLDSEFKREDLISELSRLIKVFPDKAFFYSERGLAYALAYDFEHAHLDFSQAIMLDETNESNYRNRGLCFHNIGKYNNAVGDYTKSIEILAGKIKLEEESWSKKVLAETLNMRGMTYEEMNSSESCNDYYNAAKLGSKVGLNNYRKNCSVYN